MEFEFNYTASKTSQAFTSPKMFFLVAKQAVLV